MSTLTLLRPTAYALALGAASLFSSCSFLSQNRVERTFDADELLVSPATAQNIQVETRNGYVRLHDGSPDDMIRVKVKMQAKGATELAAQERIDGFDLEIDQSTPGTIVVRTDLPGGWQNGDGVSYDITVPSVGSAQLTSSNGAIELDARSNEATLKTSNGRIDAEGCVGVLQASTSNGSVQVMDQNGPLKVRSSNGGISVSMADGCHEPFDIATSNGSVTVEVPADWPGKMRASTSNGSLKHMRAGELVAKKKKSAVFGPGTVDTESRAASSNGSVSLVQR